MSRVPPHSSLRSALPAIAGSAAVVDRGVLAQLQPPVKSRSGRSGTATGALEAAVEENAAVSIVRPVRQLAALVIVGVFGWVLAACGSPTSASRPQPVKARSLMSQ